LATGRKGAFVTRDEATKGADLTKQVGVTAATSVTIPAISRVRGVTTAYQVKQLGTAEEQGDELLPLLPAATARVIAESALRPEPFSVLHTD
jgi:hypothetical protein